MDWLHRHITQHVWDMRWFGPRSLYFKVLFTWGQWALPVPVAVMVTGCPSLSHLVILVMLSLALPSYIVKRRASDLWDKANHERWSRRQEEHERVEREYSMVLLSEVRSCVAQRDWFSADRKAWQMGDDEIKALALGYIQDHVETRARWRFECFSCGNELPCAVGDRECGYCGSMEGMHSGPYYNPRVPYTECNQCRKRTDYDDLEKVCSNCNTSSKWKYAPDGTAHKMGRIIMYI